MRLLLLCVAIATCVVSVVTEDGFKDPEVRSLYGHKAPHKKGKKCYQCAWSPSKVAYATVKKAHYKTGLSQYGQPSYTGFYHSTKKIPVRVYGGWDKCYDRFSRKQADKFGIDQWECEHNCYTRTDKNGNLYRGCYKGEYNVDPSKLGCHIQAGSRYCFCEGELCNYEQAQGYDGSTRKLIKKPKRPRKVKKVTSYKHKLVSSVKPTLYEYKPTFYQHNDHKDSDYDPYADLFSKRDLFDVYNKGGKFGYYNDHDEDKNHVGSYHKGEYKTDKKYGFDSSHKHGYGNDKKYGHEEKGHSYDGSDNDKDHYNYVKVPHPKNDKYEHKTSGYGKPNAYGHEKHKPLDPHEHDTDKHSYKIHDDFNYGKLWDLIHKKHIQSLREHGYGRGYRKHHTHKLDTHGYRDDHDDHNYNNHRYKPRSNPHSYEYGPKKPTHAIHKHVHEHKPHRLVYDTHKPTYGQNTRTYSDDGPMHKHTPAYRHNTHESKFEYDTHKPPFGYDTYKPTFDYDTQKPKFDYDAHKPTFDYYFHKPVLGYDATFGSDEHESPSGYNTHRQTYKRHNSHKPAYERRRHFHHGKTLQGRGVHHKASYSKEPLNDPPKETRKHSVHAHTKRKYDTVGLHGQSKETPKEKGKSYDKRHVHNKAPTRNTKPEHKVE